MLRYFTLEEADPAAVRAGFIVQSPAGDGCTAVFDGIAFRRGAPAGLRDGS